MSLNKAFSDYEFTSQEHPTSIKFNNILTLMDEMRYHTGPMAILPSASGSQATLTYDLQLIDDPWLVGGVVGSDGGYITRDSFTVYYHNGSRDESDAGAYARWEHMHFVSGDSDMGHEWYITLDSNTASGTVMAEYVTFTDATISSFTCVREPSTTGSY